MSHKSFQTERLLLRPTSVDDDAFILALMNTPKWYQFIGDRKIHSISAARAYIEEKMLPQLEKLGYANYTVVRKEDEQKMGTCGLYSREGSEDIDIGFAFLTRFEGFGYAYEAANRIKQAAFEEFGLKALKAFTTEANKSSQRLLEKLGMKSIGLTRFPNDNADLIIYHVDKEN